MNSGWAGGRTPLHASSTGKAFVAYLPETELAPILKEPLARYTKHTLVDLSALQAEMVLIRERGYVTGFEELEIGLTRLRHPFVIILVK